MKVDGSGDDPGRFLRLQGKSNSRVEIAGNGKPDHDQRNTYAKQIPENVEAIEPTAASEHFHLHHGPFGGMQQAVSEIDNHEHSTDEQEALQAITTATGTLFVEKRGGRRDGKSNNDGQPQESTNSPKGIAVPAEVCLCQAIAAK